MKPSLRHYYLHGFRVAAFATVLLLIRWQHQDTLPASMGEFFPTIAQAKELFAMRLCGHRHRRWCFFGVR